MLRSKWVALMTIPLAQLAGNAQSFDPVRDFCTRFDHQSTVKNDVLYIYGGSETFISGINDNGYGNGSVSIGYNNFMISIDLTSTWDWKTNISETITNITANPNTGSLPPRVVRGTLYQGPLSDKRIFLYGGTISYANTSFPGWRFPDASTYPLWSFDISSTNWDQYDTGTNVTHRPSSGAAAEAQDQGLAFYFNGLIDNGSSSADAVLGTTNVNIFLPGMVVINLAEPAQAAKNLSTKALSGAKARAHGQMQYVPNIGRNGILVQLGGSSKSITELNNLDIVDLIPMNQVGVFDIASLHDTSTPDGTWYIQNSTGTAVPSPRVDFCLIIASALDSSSHSIYMYGGRDGRQNFDEIWVLSLPSFIWTLVFSGQSPRFSHTCHLVGTRTMLTVGGLASAKQAQGLEDGNIGSCDWEIKSVGVFDISRLTWGSVYNATSPPYEVPDQVVAMIGGSPSGNASMRSPPAGFAHYGLASLFGMEPKSNSHKAIKVAAPICGVAGAALIVWFTWRVRRHMHTVPPEQPHEIGDSHSIGGPREVAELGTDSDGPTVRTNVNT